MDQGDVVAYWAQHFERFRQVHAAAHIVLGFG